MDNILHKVFPRQSGDDARKGRLIHLCFRGRRTVVVEKALVHLNCCRREVSL